MTKPLGSETKSKVAESNRVITGRSLVNRLSSREAFQLQTLPRLSVIPARFSGPVQTSHCLHGCSLPIRGRRPRLWGRRKLPGQLDLQKKYQEKVEMRDQGQDVHFCLEVPSHCDSSLSLFSSFREAAALALVGLVSIWDQGFYLCWCLSGSEVY